MDTADYSDAAGGISVILENQDSGLWSVVRVGTAERDSLGGIENIVGSRYGDVMRGDDGPNVFSGGRGSDELYGGGGDDTLNGGDDGDHLWGGAGGDILNGGHGSDTAHYGDSTAGVSVSLSTRLGFLGTAEGDTLTEIENLQGSGYDDYLEGDGNGNWLYGEDGHDTIKGGGGADTLYGGLGNDTLTGGPGRDTLFGNGDADTFVWTSTSETGVTNGTSDIIVWFSRAEGDRIRLSAIDADVYAGGNQAFRFIGTAPFTLNTATPETSDVVPGEIRYYQLGGVTYIELQTGSSPDIEALIGISGLHTPDASWFVL
jgi:Ca2+-binding RTX toxin-like protein